MIIMGHYDPVLVALSVAVAILASFTALNLSGRLLASEQAARVWWITAASIALGGGIWTMHFIGMLAFEMPMPMTFDVRLTLLSLALPILVVAAALVAIIRFGVGSVPLVSAGLLAGMGIVTMHYTGMAAMQMPAISVIYDQWLVGASVIIAIVAATAALWLAFREAHTAERVLASVVMGLAISGMHYTGMEAATFVAAEHVPMSFGPEIPTSILALALAGAFSYLLILGLATAFFDHKLATLTAREAAALKHSDERLRALHRNSSDIVATLDASGVITYEASSAQMMLGYSTDIMVGRPLSHFMRRDHAHEVEEFIQTLLMAHGSTKSIECNVRHADGTFRDFEVVGKNLLHDPAILWTGCQHARHFGAQRVRGRA